MFQSSKFSVLSSNLLLVGIFVLSLPAGTTRIYASDEIEHFAWLHSLIFDHDVSFENEYRYFYDAGIAKNPAFHETFLENTTAAGRRVNFTTMGSAVLWSPFYLAGDVAAVVQGAPRDGLGPPYVAAVAYGSAVYGFLALLIFAAIANRIVGRGFAAAAVVWFGTPLCFYMYVTPGFSHACSAFAVALFVWVWLHIRDRWSVAGIALLGVAGGLVVLVRAQ